MYKNSNPRKGIFLCLSFHFAEQMDYLDKSSKRIMVKNMVERIDPVLVAAQYKGERHQAYENILNALHAQQSLLLGYPDYADVYTLYEYQQNRLTLINPEDPDLALASFRLLQVAVMQLRSFTKETPSFSAITIKKMPAAPWTYRNWSHISIPIVGHFSQTDAILLHPQENMITFTKVAKNYFDKMWEEKENRSDLRNVVLRQKSELNYNHVGNAPQLSHPEKGEVLIQLGLPSTKDILRRPVPLWRVQKLTERHSV